MKYGVSVPVTGFYYVEVEAETEQEAINKAKNKVYSLDIGRDLDDWNIHDEIVDDSLAAFNGILNKIVIDELE